MELSGDAVARTLLTAAASNPKSLPMPLDDLRKSFGPWKERTFAATGTSTAAAAIDKLRPDPSQVAWQNVSESDRRQAVDAARKNAVSRILDSIGPVELPADKRLSDALAVKGVEASVDAWLMSCPVTSVEFRDDLEIRLMLGATPSELCGAVRIALLRQDVLAVPKDDAGWNRFCDQVETRMALPLGRSVVAAPGTGAPVAVVIPGDPPGWARDAVDTEAVAHSNGPLLRTARVAEGAAIDQLRHRVEALAFHPGRRWVRRHARIARIAAALVRSFGGPESIRLITTIRSREACGSRFILSWTPSGMR